MAKIDEPAPGVYDHLSDEPPVDGEMDEKIWWVKNQMMHEILKDDIRKKQKDLIVYFLNVIWVIAATVWLGFMTDWKIAVAVFIVAESVAKMNAAKFK